MNFKIISAILSVLILALLTFFYFMPLNHLRFIPKIGNSNFSFIENSKMQYYHNLRFSDSNISYQISDCPLKKQNEMTYAFEIIENLTSLKFYSTNKNEEISVTCENKNKITEEGFFIAGEGGPTNITIAGNFYVITRGEILLIKESNCPKPSVALHELLHVLGFNHSENPENIMYPVSNCDQTIGEDVINLINELYSIPSYPDLTFENASASLNGRFLDLETTIMNSGLNDATISEMKIYVDGNLLKEIDLGSIKFGQGLTLELKNILILQLKINNLSLIIDSDFNEISKENNKIELEIKK